MDFQKIASPAFVLDEKRLIHNLELIRDVKERAGVSIILALKGFALWKVFPLIKEYLSGATASSLYEARLIYEEMDCKAHTYAPVYGQDEFLEICSYSSHITFNSLTQYRQFHQTIQRQAPWISAGLRVNPEYSEVEVDLYNPAAPGSRLGISAEHLAAGLPEGVEGLHFHVLCESDSYALEKVLSVFEKKFGHLLPLVKWVNFGGGHLMTRKGYDIEHLVKLLAGFREKHELEVILEPGSAIAWDTGPLVTTILDIVENKGIRTAMIDASFTAHMPDTLEMPYRPKIVGSIDPVAGKPAYRIGGVSCLAGDYLLEYTFEKELKIGDQLIFEDMMHYTMVKTTMFNGVKHPDICIQRQNGNLEVLRRFRYEDYRDRLS